MAGARGAPLEDHLWTIAVARLLLPPRCPCRRRRTFAGDDFPALLAAGIDDFGGISPVTPDHVNPEAPWPQIDGSRRALRARGLDAASPRLPSTRSTCAMPDAGSTRGMRARHRSPPRRLDGSPRVGRLVAGRLEPRRRLGSRSAAGGVAPAPAVARALDGAQGAATRLDRGRRRRPALGARRRRATRVLARGRRAARRSVRRRVSTYVVSRNINYTNICYFKCGFCAFSKGKLAENLRGRPYLLSVDEVARRARRGLGARRHRGLPAGRHPSGLQRRAYLELLRR